MNRQHEILKTTINELPFSPELKNLLIVQGHKSLEDVLNVPVDGWHEYPSFTYHFQNEIVGYLMEYDLMDFLKED